MISGTLAVALAIASASIVAVLTIFYTLLTVTLFVPVVAGLYVPRTATRHVWASVVIGISTTLAVQLGTSEHRLGLVTPDLGGLLASIAAWVVSLAVAPAVDERRDATKRLSTH